MPWLKFDEKQWEELKEVLEHVINVAKEIQLEMKRANDLKEKEAKNSKGEMA
jgi:DNA-binding transcriptional regulator YhcF (GntR family)